MSIDGAWECTAVGVLHAGMVMLRNNVLFDSRRLELCCTVSLPTVFAVNELSTRKNVDSKKLIRVSLPRPFSVDC